MPKLSIVALCSLLIWALPALAAPVRSDHIEVQLIAEDASVQPGTPFWVGLRLTPDEHWKTYWRNPGGSGLPTRIDWDLPAGFQAGEIQWPYPEQFEVQGIASYGYDGEVLLMVEIRPPEALAAGRELPVKASASWLVCDDICIPGSAELSLTLPVLDSPPVPNDRWASAFAAARERLPRPVEDWQAFFAVQDGQLNLEVRADQPVFAGAADVAFFPAEPGVVANAAAQQVDWTSERLRLEQRKDGALTETPDTLTGVLVVKNAGRHEAYRISAEPGLGTASPVAAGDGAPVAPAADQRLIAMMLLALGGGLLLNLMPCVFPVLSLKAIGLMEAANLSAAAHRLHGLAYTLGVMVFFCAVAGVLYLLKAGGAGVGWGFQLQTPWFVALLAYLLVILGLSFSGVLEIGTRFMGVGQSLVQRGGYWGSFFTGALAAVVASPCTAPLMGTAIAFAITQPPLYSLLVFMSLGLGMALPFLVIAFVPAIGRILPRPGAWMDVFKQLMAFPLYLTAIWLLWVLGRQTSPTGMAVVLIGMVLLLFAIWLRHLKPTGRRWRQANAALAMTAALAALAILVMPLLRAPVSAEGARQTGDGFWVPYSTTRLAELRAEGKPVFLNVTADWCISCIANERVALSLPAVRSAFKEKNVVPLKGDWTNRQPEITRVLEAFGRTGVPLYVLFPSEQDQKPLVLPQWLSPMNVLNALRGI